MDAYFLWYYCKSKLLSSVAEPEPPGAAVVRAAPEPVHEPILLLAGAAGFKAAPAASFRKAKNKPLFLY